MTFKEWPWRLVTFSTFDQNDEETWPYQHFDNICLFFLTIFKFLTISIFWQFWQQLTFLTTFDNLIFLTILDSFDDFWKFLEIFRQFFDYFWQFLTIFDHFWQFLTIFTMFTIFDNFGRLRIILTILTTETIKTIFDNLDN